MHTHTHMGRDEGSEPPGAHEENGVPGEALILTRELGTWTGVSSLGLRMSKIPAGCTGAQPPVPPPPECCPPYSGSACFPSGRPLSPLFKLAPKHWLLT